MQSVTQITRKLSHARYYKTDRSFSRVVFEANQFRVLMTLCSYVLLQSVQEHSEDLGLLKAQMATLRDRLLKIAVRVYSSVRRIVLEFTAHHPWSEQWLQCARALSTAGP